MDKREGQNLVAYVKCGVRYTILIIFHFVNITIQIIIAKQT